MTHINLLCRLHSGNLNNELFSIIVQVSYEMLKQWNVTAYVDLMSTVLMLKKWPWDIYSFRWLHIYSCDKRSWITSKDLHWDKSPHVFVVGGLGGRWQRFRQKIPQQHSYLKLRLCQSYQLYRLNGQIQLLRHIVCSVELLLSKRMNFQRHKLKLLLMCFEKVRYLVPEDFSSMNHTVLW